MMKGCGYERTVGGGVGFHAVEPMGNEIVDTIVEAGVGAVALHSKPRCTY